MKTKIISGKFFGLFTLLWFVTEIGYIVDPGVAWVFFQIISVLGCLFGGVMIAAEFEEIESELEGVRNTYA